MEEGKAVSYSLGGTAEIKIKAPKLPPEVAVGARIHPSHRQDELCTKAAHAAAGREGSGGWAGSGPNPTGSVTSGAQVSTVVPLMLGATYFQVSAALCIIGHLKPHSRPPPTGVSGAPTETTKNVSTCGQVPYLQGTPSPQLAPTPGGRSWSKGPVVLCQPTASRSVGLWLPAQASQSHPLESLPSQAPDRGFVSRWQINLAAHCSSHPPGKGGVSHGAATATGLGGDPGAVTQQPWAPAKGATGRQRPC